MIRIAATSILTLSLAATISVAANTTPYIVTSLLVFIAFISGAFVAYAGAK